MLLLSNNIVNPSRFLLFQTLQLGKRTRHRGARRGLGWRGVAAAVAATTWATALAVVTARVFKAVIAWSVFASRSTIELHRQADAFAGHVDFQHFDLDDVACLHHSRASVMNLLLSWLT